ncbi:MAG: DUF3108 domain-containing protein [Pseudoflavonifractor sp.]|nr:DUF3108 domain-containing protein [Pseudoflavonifractor sp.]
MRNLRYAILAVIMIVSAVVSAVRAEGFADEDLQYKVMFKWGLINSKAGHATLSLRNRGTNARAVLTAASEPWADKIYRLRDTLIAEMECEGMKPLRYEKRAHEQGKYSRDIVVYRHEADNKVTGECSTYYKRKDRAASTSNHKIEATGTTVDMLSVFYYLRNLEFDKLTPGRDMVINIFSGKRNERLRLRYAGMEDVKIDGKATRAYQINFSFTSNGKKSSDDMTAWISTDSRRIPLRIEGKLPVGKVQVFYTGG